MADVATLLTERDRLDRTRAVSPLSIAPDAIVLDTTGRSIAEVVADALSIVERVRHSARS